MNLTTKVSMIITLSFIVGLTVCAQVQPFEENGKWGFKNKKGETVIHPIYDKVVDFEQSTYRIYNGKLSGIVDKNGKVLVEPRKGGVMYSTVEGFLELKVGGKAGLLKYGQAILPFEYSEIEVLNKNQIMAKQNGKWNLFNNTGKLAVKKSFEEFYKSHPQSAVKCKGKWAFLTNKNELNYLKGYQSVEPEELMFEDVVFSVKKNGKTGIYSSQGEVIPCEYDSILFWTSEYNLIVTKLDDKYGLWYFSKKNKEFQFTMVADCLYPVKQNTHLYDMIYGSDGCPHLPLIINEKVYYYDTNSLSVSKEFYDSYDTDALVNDRILKLTKEGKTITIKGNRNCGFD
jgi:hypothetical protein